MRLRVEASESRQRSATVICLGGDVRGGISYCIRRDYYLDYSLSCPGGNATARDRGANRQDFRDSQQIQMLFDITSQGLQILQVPVDAFIVDAFLSLQVHRQPLERLGFQEQFKALFPNTAQADVFVSINPRATVFDAVVDVNGFDSLQHVVLFKVINHRFQPRLGPKVIARG